jgi:hypothetical protein
MMTVVTKPPNTDQNETFFDRQPTAGCGTPPSRYRLWYGFKPAAPRFYSVGNIIKLANIALNPVEKSLQDWRFLLPVAKPSEVRGGSRSRRLILISLEHVAPHQTLIVGPTIPSQAALGIRNTQSILRSRFAVVCGLLKPLEGLVWIGGGASP